MGAEFERLTPSFEFDITYEWEKGMDHFNCMAVVEMERHIRW
jgi:hypothetical protein